MRNSKFPIIYEIFLPGKQTFKIKRITLMFLGNSGNVSRIFIKVSSSDLTSIASFYN
jgi:hypothetical protein